MNPDGSDTLVYRSEWINNNASPEWAPVEITSGKLCNGDWNRNLRVEVYDHDTGAEDDYIGAFSTNLEEVRALVLWIRGVIYANLLEEHRNNFDILLQMSAGEGFQIIQWDVINEEKRRRKEGKGDLYENSGTLILKSIKIDQVINQRRTVLSMLYSSRVGEDTFEMYLRYKYRYLRGCIFCIF